MCRTTFDPYLVQSNHSSNDCVASDIIVHNCCLRLWFVRNMPQKYPKLGRDWRLKVVLFVESRANCVKWLVEVVK